MYLRVQKIKKFNFDARHITLVDQTNWCNVFESKKIKFINYSARHITQVG